MGRGLAGGGLWQGQGVTATTGDNFDSRHLAAALGWADFHFHFDFFFAFACSLLLLLGKPQNRKGLSAEGDVSGRGGAAGEASQLLSV